MEPIEIRDCPGYDRPDGSWADCVGNGKLEIFYPGQRQAKRCRECSAARSREFTKAKQHLYRQHRSPVVRGKTYIEPYGLNRF